MEPDALVATEPQTVVASEDTTPDYTRLSRMLKAAYTTWANGRLTMDYTMRCMNRDEPDSIETEWIELAVKIHQRAHI